MALQDTQPVNRTAAALTGSHDQISVNRMGLDGENLVATPMHLQSNTKHAAAAAIFATPSHFGELTTQWGEGSGDHHLGRCHVARLARVQQVHHAVVVPDQQALVVRQRRQAVQAAPAQEMFATGCEAA